MPIDTSIYNQQAPNAIQQFGQMVGNVNAVSQLQHSRFDLANKQLGALRSAISSLLGNPNSTHSDAIQATTHLVKDGMITPAMAANSLAMIPRDPKEFRTYLTQQLLHTMNAQEKMNAVYGQPEDVGTGGGTTIIQKPALPGLPVVQRGSVPYTLPPGAEIYNPGTRQQERITTGQPGMLNAPAQGGPQLGGATPLPAAANRLPAAPPLGEQGGAEVAGQQSGTQLSTDRNSAANYQREVYPLEKAVPALEKLGTTGTGPGTEQLNDIKSFLLSAGLPPAMIRKVEDIKTFDEARKYLVDWTMQNGNVATNDKLAASFASNPSVKISNAAAVDIAKSALALRRMKHAQVLEFERTGMPESKYASWASKWNSGQDARVYGFDLMTPQQRKRVLQSLLPAKREQFMLAVDRAEDAGIIRAPQAR